VVGAEELGGGCGGSYGGYGHGGIIVAGLHVTGEGCFVSRLGECSEMGLVP
jgi:hypothetical protein